MRAAALRVQGGGVGYYPRSGVPFVHMDTGNVRHWPRMTREQLAKVFPDGRTLHIPTDGKPLPGYQLALADRERGQRSTGGASGTRSFLASLFGGGSEEREAEADADATAGSGTSRGTVIASGEDTQVELAAAEVPMPRTRPATVVAAAAPVPSERPEKLATAPAQPAPYQVAAAVNVPVPAPSSPTRDRSPAATTGAAPRAGGAPTLNRLIAERGLWDLAAEDPDRRRRPGRA